MKKSMEPGLWPLANQEARSAPAREGKVNDCNHSWRAISDFQSQCRICGECRTKPDPKDAAIAAARVEIARLRCQSPEMTNLPPPYAGLEPDDDRIRGVQHIPMPRNVVASGVLLGREYAVLERLQAAGITFCITSADNGFHWSIHDDDPFTGPEYAPTYLEAMRLLAQAAVERYPESEFAKGWEKA